MRCGAQCNFGMVAEGWLRCNLEKHGDRGGAWHGARRGAISKDMLTMRTAMRCGAQCNFGVVAEFWVRCNFGVVEECWARCNFEKHVDGVVLWWWARCNFEEHDDGLGRGMVHGAVSFRKTCRRGALR